MLKTTQHVKGKQILTVSDLQNAPSILYMHYKDNRYSDYSRIDNPVNNRFSYFDTEAIQEWLTTALNSVELYECSIVKRDTVFTDEVDNMLDDMLAAFAYEYSDSEYHQEETMENFLRQLKKKFIIEERCDEE